MVEHQPNYLHLCPVCLRKLHWNIGFDIPQHYATLLELYQGFEKHNEFFARDCAFLRQRLAALEDLPPGATELAQLRAWAGSNRSPSAPSAGLARAASVPAPADPSRPAPRAVTVAEPRRAPRAAPSNEPVAVQWRVEGAAENAERPPSSVGRDQGRTAQAARIVARGGAARQVTRRRGHSTCATGRVIAGAGINSTVMKGQDS